MAYQYIPANTALTLSKAGKKYSPRKSTANGNAAIWAVVMAAYAKTPTITFAALCALKYRNKAQAAHAPRFISWRNNNGSFMPQPASK